MDIAQDAITKSLRNDYAQDPVENESDAEEVEDSYIARIRGWWKRLKDIVKWYIQRALAVLGTLGRR